MTGLKKTIERRKNKRYKANEGSFAATGTDARTLGQIIDISLGGVCFKYIDSRDAREECETDQAGCILLSSRGCLINELPGKIVGDYPFIASLPSFSSMRLRKRHFQFMDLNVTQRAELEHHLENSVSEKVGRLSQQDKGIDQS